MFIIIIIITKIELSWHYRIETIKIIPNNFNYCVSVLVSVVDFLKIFFIHRYSFLFLQSLALNN